MATVPTLRIRDGRDYAIINEEDFDPAVHELAVGEEAPAAAAEVAGPPGGPAGSIPEPTPEEVEAAESIKATQSIRVEFDARAMGDLTLAALVEWLKGCADVATVAAVLDVEHEKQRPRRGAVEILEKRLDALAAEE